MIDGDARRMIVTRQWWRQTAWVVGVVWIAGCSAPLDRPTPRSSPVALSATIEAKPYVGSASGALVAAANPLAVDAGIEVIAAGALLWMLRSPCKPCSGS